jgi:hypothetical protein
VRQSIAQTLAHSGCAHLCRPEGATHGGNTAKSGRLSEHQRLPMAFIGVPWQPVVIWVLFSLGFLTVWCGTNIDGDAVHL